MATVGLWVGRRRSCRRCENVLSELAQTEADVIELQDEVQSLVKARDLAEQACRAGSITLTDVLDADRQLLVAQDEFDANRADAARAAVGVFRALGGRWESQTHTGTGEPAVLSNMAPTLRNASNTLAIRATFTRAMASRSR